MERRLLCGPECSKPPTEQAEQESELRGLGVDRAPPRRACPGLIGSPESGRHPPAPVCTFPLTWLGSALPSRGVRPREPSFRTQLSARAGALWKVTESSRLKNPPVCSVLEIMSNGNWCPAPDGGGGGGRAQGKARVSLGGKEPGWIRDVCQGLGRGVVTALPAAFALGVRGQTPQPGNGVPTVGVWCLARAVCFKCEHFKSRAVTTHSGVLAFLGTKEG